MKATINTGQTKILCKRLHFNTSNPDTKAVCDTALQCSLKMPHCDIISLCYKNIFCVEKQLLRPPKRWYLLMPPMCYSVNLLLFPFRAGVDDIYSNTTGTANIGFKVYFCRQWNSNSQVFYQYELPFWFLDVINVNLEELLCTLYLYVLLYGLSTSQVGKSQCLLIKHFKMERQWILKKPTYKWKNCWESHPFVSDSEKPLALNRMSVWHNSILPL